MPSNSTRRDFLHVGFAGGIGLTLADFFKIKQAQADQKFYESTEGTAKNVIFIYFPGGQCHQETFDPKPFAPLEYRGPMNSIATKIPGYRMNETLKRTAQIAADGVGETEHAFTAIENPRQAALVLLARSSEFSLVQGQLQAGR